MFIRTTPTRNSAAGETYITHRLVESRRVGGKVRQVTLLNLGRQFPLAKERWPEVCARIEQLLCGQQGLMPATVMESVERCAQQCFARLVAQGGGMKPFRATPEASDPSPSAFVDVDPDSLELTQPRSIGVEHAALAAMRELAFEPLLESLGINGVMRTAIVGSIIARMAAPGSELASHRWLTGTSGLGDLLEVDLAALPLSRLYRASDLLMKHREEIETRLFARIETLFGLAASVTLFDLTNTYFEGTAAVNPKAARGHSKEKRSDCPLVTLGVVCDGSGFIRRSRVFAGNAVEYRTLAKMLTGLAAPVGAMVIMDRGIATAANLAWLVDHGYRYLVVSRERERRFDAEGATTLVSAGKAALQVVRELSADGQEVRLHCHSAGREIKEAGIMARFCTRFEAGLTKLAEGLTRPRGENQSRGGTALHGDAGGRCGWPGGHRVALGEDACPRHDADRSGGLLFAQQRAVLGCRAVVAYLHDADGSRGGVSQPEGRTGLAPDLPFKGGALRRPSVHLGAGVSIRPDDSPALAGAWHSRLLVQFARGAGGAAPRDRQLRAEGRAYLACAQDHAPRAQSPAHL